MRVSARGFYSRDSRKSCPGRCRQSTLASPYRVPHFPFSQDRFPNHRLRFVSQRRCFGVRIVGPRRGQTHPECRDATPATPRALFQIHWDSQPQRGAVSPVQDCIRNPQWYRHNSRASAGSDSSRGCLCLDRGVQQSRLC